MSSGRLFLDRVARQQSPSPLRRQAQHISVAGSKERIYHRTVTSVLTGCLTFRDRRTIWLNPDFSSPYILLGKAYAKTKQLALAEGVLKRALRMDPNNAGTHYLLGGIYREMGRTEDSRKEFDLWKKLKEE
jgi:Tfp pilus assembly protein PilF